MAREATPRRSARLCRDSSTSVNNNEAASPLNPAAKLQLASITEREGTPRSAHKSSADHAIATPSTSSKLKDQLQDPTSVKTPKTEPRPGRDQLHPEIVHRSAKKPSSPTSGERLGFVDISREPRGSAPENTPSHPSKKIDPSFQFHFSKEPNLSSEGRRIMESIREDADRIKAQMKAEKDLQDKKDAGADAMFVGAAGRKIAKPAGKAGRFSDVHMAQFKKMDSIANHASAFRANPTHLRPTAQSLKRTSSKADLDSPERPKTAGKSPSIRVPPPVTGRPMSTSPFKSIRCVENEDEASASASAKRVRRNGDVDVAAAKPSVIPRPTSSRIMSPTKSSMARSSTGNATTTTPRKNFLSSRQKNSVKSLKSIRDTKTSFSPVKFVTSTPVTTSLLPQTDKPLPSTPGAWPSSAATARSRMIEEADHAIPANVEQIKPPATTSKLPTFAGLKSILRKKGKATPARAIDPKRPNTVGPLIGTPKKVDFTPSVKSRYAVKLAAASPSPAKHELLTVDKFEPVLSGDTSAIRIGGTGYDWDDESDDNVCYPDIPPSPIKPGPVIHTFSQKAKHLDRRESKEFKSALANLDATRDSSPQLSLTSINTEVNKTGPIPNLNRISAQTVSETRLPSYATSPKKHTPHWRGTSDLSSVRLPFSFQSHGLPDKKRRRESVEATHLSGESDKENSNSELHDRQSAKIQSHVEGIPAANDDEIDGERFVKRRRTALPTSDGPNSTKAETNKVSQVSFGTTQGQEQQNVERQNKALKPNAAREQAKKHAMQRKSRGLSLSRLNALASPKKRV